MINKKDQIAPNYLFYKIGMEYELNNNKIYLFQIGQFLVSVELVQAYSFTRSDITFKKESKKACANNLLLETTKNACYPSEEPESMIILKIQSNMDKENKKASSLLFNYFPNKEEITLGRSQANDIHLEGQEISKVHCTIYYNNQSKKWVLIDGNRMKKSSNGIFEVVYQTIKLPRQKSTFKYSNSIFCIKFDIED